MYKYTIHKEVSTSDDTESVTYTVGLNGMKIAPKHSNLDDAINQIKEIHKSWTSGYKVTNMPEEELEAIRTSEPTYTVVE